MRIVSGRGRAVWLALGLSLAAGAAAQEKDPQPQPVEVPAEQAPPVLTPEQERARKLGFYFDMTLERLSLRGAADGLGVVVPKPPLPGTLFPVAGPEVNGDFGARLGLGFRLGFRLRNDKGRIEGTYQQWDEAEDLRTDLSRALDSIPLPVIFDREDRLAFETGRGDQAIANTLTSPDAGFFEDFGRFAGPSPPTAGPPDGSVTGVEVGVLSEGSEPADAVKDGAEDVNYNGRPDFIRFDTADAIVGSLETDFKLADIDYVRRLKRLRRFTLEGRVGLRAASFGQDVDLAYRDTSSFAVFSDTEPDPNTATFLGWDGDGDGRDTNNSDKENDGDGFGGTGLILDQLESAETISEDRIVANIETAGIGLKLGVEGHFELSKKWRLRGGIDVAAMKADSEVALRETFTSQRDRFPNYVDWDFNGDGHFNAFDLDFDGSCALMDEPSVENCERQGMTQADVNALVAMGGIEILQQLGSEFSVVDCPTRLNCGAYTGGINGILEAGDAVPESERNDDTVTEITVLNDARGSKSGVLPMVGLHVGLEYQFSRFATLSFGFKTLRWFDAGNFRDVAGDMIAGRAVEPSGDLALDGYFLTLTIIPR